MQMPTAPGALLGHRSNGQPIYLIAGGSGEGDEQQADTGAEPSAQPAEAAADADVEALLAEAVREDDTGDATQTFDAKYVRELREEAARNRVSAKAATDSVDQLRQEHQAQMDAIAKALGLKDEDAPPDPEELTKQLTAAQAEKAEREVELRTLRTENAAKDAARHHGADVDALLDSKSFNTALSKLDPSDEGFAQAVNDLVAETVEAHPKYKAAGQAPPASSANFSGGSGEQRDNRSNGLFAAFNKRYGG